jgi:hypothetical protein
MSFTGKAGTMLPFTQEQFFSVFRAYNDVVWPASIVAYGLAILPVLAALRPTLGLSRIAAVVLAMMWAWTGVVYHGLFFSVINHAPFLFSVPFVLQSLLFIYYGLVTDSLEFRGGRGLQAIVGWIFIAYAAIAYPAIGFAIGHLYSELPQFGTTPCPVTIFTFGILLLARPPIPWVLLVIPVIWSLIGGSAAILLAVPQDWLLLASGVMTAVILFASRSVPETPDLSEK